MDKEIRIILHRDSSHIYTPGEHVSGTVVFIPHFNCRIKSLKLSLRGECYISSFGANTKVSNSIVFFTLSSLFLEGTYTYTENLYELPFTFTFPATSTGEFAAGPTPLRSLFDQGPQLLPDSFTLSSRNLLQCVRYSLRVDIIGRQFRPKECTILFHQPNDMTIEHPVTIVHSLPAQVSLAHEHDSKTWATIAHWFRSFAFVHYTPQVAFTPCIHAPTSVVIGQVIPLSIAIDTSGGKKAPDASPLLLESISISITAHTRTILQNRPSKRRYGRCIELSYTVLDARELGIPLAIDGPSIPITKDFRISPGAIPSFKTYIMNRGYTIDLKFRLRYGVEAFDWEESTNLTLYADPTARPVTGYNIDPLLFYDPRSSPQTHWQHRVEAGAAEGTGRSEFPPDAGGST
jgi:hypothetical protein